VPSCTGRTARLFFMLEARGSQGATVYVTAPKPTSAGRRGLDLGHVAVPEPNSAGRRGPEP
jgi:hypothetical protein